MNLLGYIDKFGGYSFEDKPFNDVDALICATLSYLNFELYQTSIEINKLYLKDIPDPTIGVLCEGEFTTSNNIKLIKKLKTSNRYKDASISNVCCVNDKLNTIQFFAMLIHLPFCEPVVSFRGTDLNLVGWKEDLMLIYSNVVPSDVEALNYLYDISKKIDSTFKVVGHSKGGNLAIFSSIFALKSIKNKISKVYSFDGPGFKDEAMFETQKYFDVKNKIIQYFPKDDVVGSLFHTPSSFYIIKAKSFSVFQHDPYRWLINEIGEFKLEKEFNKLYFIRKRAIINWVKQLKDEDKDIVIESLIALFGGVNSNLINFIKYLPKKLYYYFSIRKKYSHEKIKKIKEIKKLLIRSYKEAFQYYREK